ncbi:aldehyde ferredoxin oxidoreductase family protein [Hydrogenobacter sp. T-2]|uniref:aldehyde ferredoxin oxidoreductase family protein n=1 Tax=Pampinifervens diazotrophicum TaxID=1632018 RepID=UPI002B256FFD|nr:aldehyde ferredoxin oxidoreductase family protein [Hydrogenobacter sp. T-2]WPM31473.1 aldehyde ferredoxin oxidoreductase family protein [Hydrogenobacter sp. T-2]
MSWFGRYLFIDLTHKRVDVYEVPERVVERYIGGNGIGAYLLYTLMKKGIDPLSEENILIVNTGPANGTLVPMSSKFGVYSKSPQTMGFTKGFCGGEFGHECKFAGWDGIIITGSCDQWTHIHIENQRVYFFDAEYLRGFHTSQAQQELKRRYGEDIKALVIGPAGENLVKYACIISDLRAVGTGGMGAVMGSKRIKAITVRGTKLIEPKNPKRLIDFVKEFEKAVYSHPGVKNLIKYGTSAGVMHLQHLGILPSYNWQKEVFPYAEEVSGERLRERVIKDVSCPGCIVPCGKYSVAQNTFTVGPEYEGIYAMGTIIGNGNLDHLIELDRLTDELGLGQIQTGGVVAWVMECYEKGLLKREDLDGLELYFGNTEAVRELLRKIAFREGIGDLLAEGSEKASRRLGVGGEFVMTVKGMETAGHSPRAVKTQALGYAVANRGPVHCDIRPGLEENNITPLGKWEGKGKVGKDLAVWTSIVNSIIYCLSAERVVGLTLNEKILDMVNALMDWDMSMEELYAVGERVYTLERLFNVREGFSRKDDTLPRRILEEPSEKGYRTSLQELNAMIKEFYQAFGWDELGIPKKETLIRLSMEEFTHATS